MATVPLSTNGVQRTTLLQEGISCAVATLYAIQGADLFRALPADEADQDQHNHGCWLLSMLGDQLANVQRQIDALENAAVAAAGEGANA